MLDIIATFGYSIYEKPDKSYQVLQYKDMQQGSRFVAVGRDLPTNKHLSVHLFGDWVNTPKGKNFKVEYTDIARQDGRESIIAYLTSLKCGCGSIKAEKIYDHFKDDTWDMLRDEPWRVSDVPGIGTTLASKISKAVEGSFAMRNILRLFNDAGARITPAQANSYLRDNPIGSMDLLKNNPYRIIKNGVTFADADALAISLGLSPLMPERIDAYMYRVMADAAVKGHVCLPIKETSAAFENGLALSGKDAAAALNDAWRRGSVKVLNGMAYTKKSFDEEDSIVKNILRLSKAKETISRERIEPIIDKYEKESKVTLAEQQRAAVNTAFSSSVSIITGGPGTGKTTVIKAILYVLKNLIPDAVPVLLAPTGRAARRMSDATGCAAQTIHSAVGYKGEEVRPEDGDIDGDMVIIDECSMMDQFIASVLFKKVLDGAQVILVGDPGQLPSVGAGNILADMISSKVIPTTKLSVIYRQQGNNPIITNADKIRSGKTDLLFGNTFKFFESTDPSTIVSMGVDFYIRCVKAYGIDNVVLLNPQRNNTDVSVDVFNSRIQERLNPSTALTKDIKVGKTTFRIGDRVMQTKNTEAAKNGDTGVIKNIRTMPAKDDPETWLHEVDVEFNSDGTNHVYTMETLKQLELAYCCTVHKSQGQEYETVIEIVSSEHRSMLKRNLLYTGITRSRKYVALIGDMNAICKSIRNDKAEERHTNLAKLLSKTLL